MWEEVSLVFIAIHAFDRQTDGHLAHGYTAAVFFCIRVTSNISVISNC